MVKDGTMNQVNGIWVDTIKKNRKSSLYYVSIEGLS